MKWSDIERQILGKLFLTQEESKNQGYWGKFRDLANECLYIVANGVKPKIKEMKFVTFKKDVEAYVGNDIYLSTLVGGDWQIKSNVECLIIDDHITLINGHLKNNEKVELIRKNYSDDNIYEILISAIDEYCCEVIYNSSGKYNVINMPDDFLSFSDLINYFNDCKNPDIIYLSDKKIKVNKNGEYKIFYNALYPEITEEIMLKNNDLKDIDTSLLYLIIAYVAYNVLEQDDIQRSMILKNEFELALSRLDTNILYESNSFKSDGGWY